MKYFVLTISEDGDVYLYEKTQEEVLEEIKDGEIDPEDIGTEVPNGDVMSTSGTYIFKGELVVPKPKKVVEEYELS